MVRTRLSIYGDETEDQADRIIRLFPNPSLEQYEDILNQLLNLIEKINEQWAVLII